MAAGAPAIAAVTNDTTFGNLSGLATISQGGMLSDNARDIAVDADGKIILAGFVDQPPFSAMSNNFALALARLTVNGLPDATFSGDGRLFMTTCAGSPNGTWNPKLALQADGKILVGATCVSLLYEQIVLVRFLGDGSLDNSLDTDGILYLPNPVADRGSRFADIAVQADGKIVVAGTYGTNNLNPQYGVVLRLNADGTPDTTFATQGTYTAGERTHFLALDLMADGRILAAGYGGPAGATITDVFVTRLTAAGAPDSTFGTNGAVIRNVGVRSAPLDPDFATMDLAYAIAVRADGRILVGGTSRDSLGLPRYEPFVLQLTTGGALDTGWGQDGFVSLGGVPGDPHVLALKILPNGEALIGGQNMPFTHVTADGLETSSDSIIRRTYGIAVQSGKAVIATATPDPSTSFQAMRFDFSANSDNTPDAFTFAPVLVQPLGVPVQSATVTLTGFAINTDVSAVNGGFAIDCTGTVVPAGETRVVPPGTTLCLSHVTSETSNTTITTTLTVGGVSAEFSSTTGDGTPDALSFTNQTGVATSTAVTSAAVTVSGINVPVKVTVSGGEHSVGCTGTFVSTEAQITNGQTLCLRHTSSASASTVTTTTARVGDVMASFASTTAAATAPPTTPPVTPPSTPPAAPPAGGGGGGGSFDWLLLGLLAAALVYRSRAPARRAVPS